MPNVLNLDDKPVGQGVIAVLAAVGLFIWDWITVFDGYKLRNFSQVSNFIFAALWGFYFLGIVIWVIIRAYVHNESVKHMLLDIAFAAVMVLCGLLNFGDLNMIRLVMLYSCFILFVMNDIDDEEEKFKHKMTFMGLLVLDYFIIGAIDAELIGLKIKALRLYFPFYIVYFSAYYAKKTKALFFSFTNFILALFFVFSLMGGKELFYPELAQLSSSERTGFQNSLLEFGQFMASIPSQIQKGWNETFNPSYTYGGTQEQTKNPQGVYLNEIEKGDMLFFEETPVLLWAVLEARTLEKPIDAVNVKCTTELEDGTVAEGIVNEGTTIYSFPVYSGVDRPLSCRFDGIIEGDYEAKFEAEFDFTTESRQLIYLMDRTRYTEELIALRRQGSAASSDDVLRSVDITDTSPESIYTSGPIAVLIGTNSFPWDIGDANNILYRFGVEITNEWQKGGELKSINKVRFIMPSTFSMVKNSCGVGMNYDSPKIVNGEKIYETTQAITDVEDERTVNCLLRVDKSSLDSNVEVTRRYLKAAVDYTFIMEKNIDFEVEKLHDETDQAHIDADSVCCKVGSTYSTLSKEECSSKGIQTTANKCYDYCCEIKESGKSNSYIWVASQTMCDEYDSSTKQAAIISDESKCPTK